jgi:hypothetical protein
VHARIAIASGFRRAVIVLALVCAAASLEAQRERELVKVALHDVPPIPDAANPLRALEVSGTIAPTQRSAAGVRLEVILVNKGSEPLTILDPSARSQPQILTEEGWPVELVPTVPPWRIHQPTSDAGPPTLTLPPNRETPVAIVVPHVLTEQKYLKVPPSTGSAGPASTAPLPPGKYKVKFRVFLATAAPVANNRRASRILESNEIPLLLEP